MNLEFLLLAIICNYLRKMLRNQGQLPVWQKIFLGGFVVSILMLILEVTVSGSRNITVWFGHALIIALIYVLITKDEFKSVKSRLYIILPLIIVNLTKDLVSVISNSFYVTYKNYFEVASLFAFIWLVVMLILNNKQRKALEREKEKAAAREREFELTEKLKAQLEIQVAERTAELTLQKEALEKAIVELKATQSQLIQSEKMASLGELTAGIAHEIQNPLNFVNNFSEVNKELLAELNEEIAKGNYDDVKAIANDITNNEEKIMFHGKRADAIVKGMLQHSRSSSGVKEPTDLNALCDEYLRLAYHGLRAKDKSFNATMKTDFDESIGTVNIVPQDMGRVILNLITNAFYAVTERKKQTQSDYEPTVSVNTKKLGDKVLISVSDNGNGIPQKILDKIFQPFFTTKPTGQGTGLGLSLSYDIVKAHGGELKAETKEGEGSKFIIQLPVL
jgi:two-component system NtrC family sensor kinase